MAAVIACFMPKTTAELHLRHEPAHEVSAWAATVPPGTRGTAAELLPLFLTSGPPAGTCYGVPWSPGSLGASLARLLGRVLDGRAVTRRLNRKGVSVYTVEAAPRAGAAS